MARGEGNAANAYSFKGKDPEPYVEGVSSTAADKTYEELLTGHLQDYTSLQGSFSLDLPGASRFRAS